MLWRSKKLKFGKMYACTAGFYAGQLLIYIESDEDAHGFLSVPEMKNVWVPKDKFDFGIANDILEFIENVPTFVKKTSKIQFAQNKF